MIALFLLAYVVIALFAIIAIFEKNLKLHIIIITLMYGYYGWLWYERLFMIENVKPAWVGFSLFLNTIFTAPFYIIYHLLAIYKSWRSHKAIVYVNIAGLLLWLLHITYMLS